MLYHIKNLVKSRSGEKGYKLLIQNLRIAQGERLAITGPSGCGKSTVLDLLGLALSPDSADVFNFDPGTSANGSPDASVVSAGPAMPDEKKAALQNSPGQPKNRHDDQDAGAQAVAAEEQKIPVPITPDSVRVMELWKNGELDQLAALRLDHMGYVLQSGELLPFLTVAENMELTARLGGMEREEAAGQARRLAEQLGISHLLGAMPNTLSFGERQRAAIVRALAGRPQVILADEPTASLDPLHAEKVMESFMQAIERNGATLILVTHNMPWAKTGSLRELPFKIMTDGSGLTAILDDGISSR